MHEIGEDWFNDERCAICLNEHVDDQTKVEVGSKTIFRVKGLKC